MLYVLGEQYKKFLSFVILCSIIIVLNVEGIPSTSSVDKSNRTNSTLTTTITATIPTIFPTSKACFYGVDASNTAEFVEICVNQSLAQLDVKTEISDIPSAENLNDIWMLLTAAMVFVMQCGFSLLEVGMVQKKNIQTVIFKNLMNAAVTAIGYYLFGFCLSYGKLHSSNPYLGVGDTVILSHKWDRWFYEWTFAVTASTIASCAFSERATLFLYLYNSLCMVWWTYSIIVHWLWSETGWLSPFHTYNGIFAAHLKGGAIDFAGSCVVFIVGGFVGLAGAILLGPRKNRFSSNDNDKNVEKKRDTYIFGRDAVQQILGCLIIWFGFYGFTCGRTLQANERMLIASKVAVNTTLSAGMGCIIAVAFEYFLDCIMRQPYLWKVSTLCNGILIGLVSISASCAVVDPWMAIIIGAVGGVVYVICGLIQTFLQSCCPKLAIDDPLNVSATFGVGGCWGIIAEGYFGYHQEAMSLAGYPVKADRWGYGQRWGRQFVACVVVSCWAFFLGIIFLGFLKLVCFFAKHMGWFRIDEDKEEAGLDAEYHDENNRGFALADIIKAKFFKNQ